MTTSYELLQELTLEAALTRLFLERVPFDNLEFKPADDSESLGRLAVHAAEIIAWWKACIVNDQLDFADFEPKEFDSVDGLLSYFDSLLAEAKTALIDTRDEGLDKEWSMVHGEDILFTLPKKQVLRLFCMNHLVHHRAQLGVYLRILGITLPATYGPSANDDNVLLIKRFEYQN